MMVKCKGCGITLQSTDKNLPGYTPKPDAAYCQRCFRLIHYDDLTVSMRKEIEPDSILKQISEMDGLILLVADLFDFEASMIPGLKRILPGRDMILAVTKRDLLPDTVSHEKIAHFIFRRLKEEGTEIRDLVLTSSVQNEGMDELLSLIRQYRKDKPVIVIGRANSGKSTLLNQLAGDTVLTASRYPGTTLDFNEIMIEEIPFIDTPGIEISQSILMETDEKDLKRILPPRTVKPQIFQLKNDQSFAVGGLARVDVLGCTKATAVWYCSDALTIHRGKADNADMYWKKHYGEELVPVPLHNQFRQYAKRKDEDKMDVVIDGLGWVCLSGDIRTVKVHVPKNVNVTFRKAMI